MSEASATESKKVEKRQFKAETKQLLNLMINSLYTHKEIFLRELISNASDALDKVRFRSLTDTSIMDKDKELEIWISIDKKRNTLSLSDNGIGMTKKEVIKNIGTIAQSGSDSFLKALEKTPKDGSPVDLIGQFGVGFYSAFMVADRAELVTRAAGQSKATRWVSKGEGSYTLEDAERESRGTTVTLHIRKELVDPDRPEDDYLNQYTVQNLVKRYSDYIRYPIKMGFETDDYPRDDKGEVIKDAKPNKKIDIRTMNSMLPLWERNKKDVKEDEYFQFFKHHFKDWNEPTDIIHIKVEGTVQYTALLYVPSKASGDFYSSDYKKGIQLYSKHVFVMDNCRDLFPEHLRFVRGLVDSPDFSLNISREILQHDRQIRIVAKNLEKKVMEALKNLLTNERKKYEEWWEEFGKAIKGGIYMHYTNKEKLEDFLLFPSSHSEEGMSTLREYVSRMPEWQDEIYYEVGKDRAAIERLPQMEVIREKGVEVLYFIDKVDEFLTQNLYDYDEKQLKSVSRGELNLDKKKKKKKKKGEKNKKEKEDKKDEKPKEHEELLKAMKEHLGEKVKEVRISKRLKKSPVCLVASDSGPSFNMEQLLQGANQLTPKAARILELNAGHEIFKILVSEFEKDQDSHVLQEYSDLLFYQAMLIEGFTLEDPVEFAGRINALMVAAGGKGESS